MRSIKNLQNVVDWNMCSGCGACYYYCKRNAVTLFNVESVGIRPLLKNEICDVCAECLSICPGYFLDARRNDFADNVENTLIGPTLEIWEGFSTDRELRYSASSGGILSSLALYCLKEEGVDFVLHTGLDPEVPYFNKTVRSQTKSDLIARTGSRYSPASPCDSLRLIEESKGKCVFIGKPCDAAAVNLLRRQRKGLDDKIGLVLTFFCAGTPSTQATLNLFSEMDVNSGDVKLLRYRGEGWPGRLKVVYSNHLKEKSLSYMESWHSLQKHRPLRCHLCPDGLGEIADISCGDAWHLYSGDGDDGHSLVLVRTERGRKTLKSAVDAGYITLKSASPSDVIYAQGLVSRRKELFGRLLVMRALFIPIPLYRGFNLFKDWLKNPLPVKIRTLAGSFRRIITRGLLHKNPVFKRQPQIQSIR